MACCANGILDLQGDIWLVANVSEEGLGDLRGMKAVVERFGSNVQAYLVLEGTALWTCIPSGHWRAALPGSRANGRRTFMVGLWSAFRSS